MASHWRVRGLGLRPSCTLSTQSLYLLLFVGCPDGTPVNVVQLHSVFFAAERRLVVFAAGFVSAAGFGLAFGLAAGFGFAGGGGAPWIPSPAIPSPAQCPAPA